MTGSCLCGAVQYQVDRLAGPIVHCHCHTCQKAHAAAHSSTARVDRAAFRWLRGESYLTAYPSSPGKLRHFCKRCGSHLVAEWTDAPQVIVRVATLDEDPGARPAAHIWVSSASPWLTDSAETASFPEFAPGPSPRAAEGPGQPANALVEAGRGGHGEAEPEGQGAGGAVGTKQ
jgi:hypothetical protein